MAESTQKTKPPKSSRVSESPREMEAEEHLKSPTDSQKTISDDDEIDYSIKPEFYDSDLDEKDELWVQKKRKGRTSDAVLSCPGCFTTLCLECQRHEKYVTQYRAIFVVNCNIKSEQVLPQRSMKIKRGKRGRESDKNEAGSIDGETFKSVHCGVCSTEVGAIDEDEVYHFFNVLPILAVERGMPEAWRMWYSDTYTIERARFPLPASCVG